MLWRGDVTGVSFDNGNTFRTLKNLEITFIFQKEYYQSFFRLKKNTYATFGTDLRSSGALGPSRRLCMAALHES